MVGLGHLEASDATVAIGNDSSGMPCELGSFRDKGYIAGRNKNAKKVQRINCLLLTEQNREVRWLL